MAEASPYGQLVRPVNIHEYMNVLLTSSTMTADCAIPRGRQGRDLHHERGGRDTALWQSHGRADRAAAVAGGAPLLPAAQTEEALQPLLDVERLQVPAYLRRHDTIPDHLQIASWCCPGRGDILLRRLTPQLDPHWLRHVMMLRPQSFAECLWPA